MPNPLRTDPTRTARLRQAYMRALRKRIDALFASVRHAVEKEDRWELGSGVVANAQGRFVATTSDAKLKDFNVWLQSQIDAGLLSIPKEGFNPEQPWMSTYVDSAYRKGIVDAYIAVHGNGAGQSSDFYEGKRDEFLRGAFAQPEMMSKVRLLATRNFEELKGISAWTGSQLNRIMADAIANGRSASQTSRDIRARIPDMTKQRADTLARTEIIRAHAEGSIDSFQLLGVDQLALNAEWSTAGDDRVCPVCAGYQGRVFSLKEARGMIPLHPNCRCSWLPTEEKVTFTLSSILTSPTK